jgi:hypothetical protein
VTEDFFGEHVFGFQHGGKGIIIGGFVFVKFTLYIRKLRLDVLRLAVEIGKLDFLIGEFLAGLVEIV